MTGLFLVEGLGWGSARYYPLVKEAARVFIVDNAGGEKRIKKNESTVIVDGEVAALALCESYRAEFKKHDTAIRKAADDLNNATMARNAACRAVLKDGAVKL